MLRLMAAQPHNKHTNKPNAEVKLCKSFNFYYSYEQLSTDHKSNYTKNLTNCKLHIYSHTLKEYCRFQNITIVCIIFSNTDSNRQCEGLSFTSIFTTIKERLTLMSIYPL